MVVKIALGADDEHQGAEAGGPGWRLANEWASLELLGRLRLETPLAPRLLGADRTAGVLVVEDLGAGARLDHLLLGEDGAAAEAGLLAYARALGRMQAATTGEEERYTALRARVAPPADRVVSTAAEAPLDGPALVAGFRRAAAAVDVALGEAADADLDAVAAFWDAPPVRTLVHADACPDNCLLLADGARLIDFEFGGFHHPLIDGAGLRLGFPSCWCAGAIPDDVVERSEAAYRAALTVGCGWAEDERAFGRALVEACAYWTVGMFAWAVPGLLGDDLDWGLVPGRQRVLHRLEQLARISERERHLAALGLAARKLRERLAGRWPETEPMAAVPAFRKRGA